MTSDKRRKIRGGKEICVGLEIGEAAEVNEAGEEGEGR